MRSLVFILLMGIWLGGALSSCALYRNDRCYLTDPEYVAAKKYYDKSNSLVLTEEYLQDRHWARCKVNEALYRLKKEYELE